MSRFSPREIGLAITASKRSLARLAERKAANSVNPPRAAVGRFPYPARRVSEITEAEMPRRQRRSDFGFGL